MITRFLAGAASAALLVLSAPASAAAASPELPAASIVSPAATQAVNAFYARRNAPLWLRGGEATSAARDAVNGYELIDAIERSAKLKLKVISGDEEASWAFRGVTTDPAFRDQDLLVRDVGGGSTEFIKNKNGNPPLSI